MFKAGGHRFDTSKWLYAASVIDLSWSLVAGHSARRGGKGRDLEVVAVGGRMVLSF